MDEVGIEGKVRSMEAKCSAADATRSECLQDRSVVCMWLMVSWQGVIVQRQLRTFEGFVK